MCPGPHTLDWQPQAPRAAGRQGEEAWRLCALPWPHLPVPSPTLIQVLPPAILSAAFCETSHVWASEIPLSE